MKTNLKINGLDCLCCKGPSADKVTYILYPMDMLSDWIEGAVARYATTIVVITGMDWDNVFSPWPAPGQPPGSPDFKGDSQAFLDTLRRVVLPSVEKQLGVTAGVRRTLAGVSMSGLFALWQWMVCDTFADIASLSGSFWYPGFVEWVKEQAIPRKEGRAYFLLGDQESKSRVKAFEPVGRDTKTLVTLLKAAGVSVEFESVPGNHFADPIPRLDRALAALHSQPS